MSGYEQGLLFGSIVIVIVVVLFRLIDDLNRRGRSRR